MVQPSGSDLATNAAPMVPPAPGRFSTTTGCPTCCESCSSSMRGIMSVELPAATGTTARNGFVGQLCAPVSVGGNERIKTGTNIRQIGFMTTSLAATDSIGSVQLFDKYIIALYFMPE